MTTPQTLEKPADWPGSLPEYVALVALRRLGKLAGEDFTYQSALAGGRMEKGGVVLDFMFFNPPDLAINIQGDYYHYELGTEIRSRDIIAREQMASQGIFLIFVDESDLLKDPIFYMREALNYRDHSRMGRGK